MGSREKTIMILGGYGKAGLALARLLLKETRVRIILAGRSARRGVRAARQLNQAFGRQHASGLQVDAENPSSLGQAFEKCHLVVVCVPVASIGGAIASAAFHAGIDYLDLNLDHEKERTLRQLAPSVKSAGRCFITEGGFMPGLPSMMALHGANHFDQIRKITQGVLMITNQAGVGSEIDLLTHQDVRPHIFREGRWQPADRSCVRMLDYKSPFGKRLAFPFDLAELKPLPRQLGLDSMGFYISGSGNRFIGYLMRLIRKYNLGATRYRRRVMAHLLKWACYFCVKPPFGTYLCLQAEGLRGNRSWLFSQIIGHEDAYKATAIPTMAFLLQYLDGSLHCCGVHMMGHCVDPDRFLADMQGMGMHVSEHLQPASET